MEKNVVPAKVLLAMAGLPVKADFRLFARGLHFTVNNDGLMVSYTDTHCIFSVAVGTESVQELVEKQDSDPSLLHAMTCEIYGTNNQFSSAVRLFGNDDGNVQVRIEKSGNTPCVAIAPPNNIDKEIVIDNPIETNFPKWACLASELTPPKEKQALQYEKYNFSYFVKFAKIIQALHGTPKNTGADMFNNSEKCNGRLYATATSSFDNTPISCMFMLAAVRD